jgi:hypothetical protein
MEAEYFTSLAAEVERFVADGKHRMLITSSGPGEGKSTVAAGLARSLARSGRTSVVLVDTDHLRPTIHRLFRVDNYHADSVVPARHPSSTCARKTRQFGLATVGCSSRQRSGRLRGRGRRRLCPHAQRAGGRRRTGREAPKNAAWVTS